VSRHAAARPRTRRSYFRPTLETLEDRLAPAVDFSNLATVWGSYDTSHILVQFEAGFSPALFLPAGATLGEKLPLLQDFYEVNLPIGRSVPQMLTAIENSPHVLFAQPDYVLTVDQTVDDPSFGSQWGLNNTGQSGGTPDADIDAPEAWDVTTGTGKIIVAVIDTGVDYTHPDLAANMWVNTGEIAGNGIDDDHDGYIDDVYGYDFVNNDGDPMDDNSHGTHCAGIIGAVGDNGTGVAGVIWDVQIMAVKFLGANGSGYTSDAIKALDFAVSHGAQITSNSWGGGSYSQALSDAITNAAAHGVIFVAAAGNNGASDDTKPFYPASYTQDNIVAVAATDRYDHLASYSNYGATSVDIAAPGTSIYSTIPVSMGSYASKSGTSMATPFVAGALALVWDLHPDWTYTQVIDQVLGTVDPLSSLDGKVASGGRLNLANALGAPVDSSPAPAPAPSLAINNVSLSEGNSGTTSFTFTVTLSAASTQTVTVNWATANSSAAAPGDFTAAGDVASFAPGEISKDITVLVNGDTTVESNETFYVDLSGAQNATISTSRGVGTILNDDTAAVTLSIGNASVVEGNKGTKFAVFTVTLSAASSQTVTVKYATANGTAVAGSDYIAASGTLTFTPGVTSQTIKIKIKGDTTVEQDEIFYVNLSSATNATLQTSQGTGTILDDDA
jgi:subtilisin family serine protease